MFAGKPPHREQLQDATRQYPHWNQTSEEAVAIIKLDERTVMASSEL